MTDIALEMAGVSKKFKRGEIYDSLRDLIPALTGKLLRNSQSAVLDEREFWALDDVSFQVQRGEAFGIIGANGAGKSTILKHLSGIMKPTKGTIIVNGTLSALIEVGAGFHPDLTGRENIYLNGTILGMKRAEIDRKFDEIVAFSGLEEFIDTPVKRYSSGMYARLGFSVAAHVDPDILVVDEVLSVGDRAFQRRCMEKMTEVLHGGSTVIFVSHNLRAVSHLCGRSLLLVRGRIADIGPTGQVIRHYIQDELGNERDTSQKEVFVSKVTVRNSGGESALFEVGDKAWVDVEITARERCSKIDVKIGLRDQNEYDIFNVSLEGLGLPAFELEAGQKGTCTFELHTYLAPGTYSLFVHTERHDILKAYDYFFNAATMYITSDRDVRGCANLNPVVDARSIRVVPA